MTYYSVTAVFQGEVVFFRDTPLEAGVMGLVIEASSKLMKVADSATHDIDDGYVIVEKFWESYSVPEIEMVLLMDEVEDVLLHQYNDPEEVWELRPHEYYAETTTKRKGTVKTMSGKPHKPRKLTQDQGISPEEAAKRLAFKSDTESNWRIESTDTYDTIFGTRLDGKLFNELTGEKAEFVDAEIEPPYVVENPYQQLWGQDYYEDEDEDEDDEYDDSPRTTCDCGATQENPCACLIQGEQDCTGDGDADPCPCHQERINKTLGGISSILGGVTTEKETEEEAYSYAYNEGHSDARKRNPYKPNPSSKETGDFRKVIKQRAENTWKPKSFESENKVFKSPLDDKSNEIL